MKESEKVDDEFTQVSISAGYLEYCIEQGYITDTKIRAATETLIQAAQKSSQIEDAAKLGYEMSRYAAASKERNTKDFLYGDDGLFAQIKNFQQAYDAAKNKEG